MTFKRSQNILRHVPKSTFAFTEAARHLQMVMPMSRFVAGDVPASKVPKLQITEPCGMNRKLLLGRKMNRSLSNADF